MLWTLHHVLRRAATSLVRNLGLNLVAAGVIAAALLLAATWMVVVGHLDRMASTWGQDVHVSAYFQPDVSTDRRFALLEQVQARPEVARVVYVSEEDARTWLAERVPETAELLGELGAGVLPASLEITLAEGHLAPAEVAAFAASLEGPDFASIDFGQEWVQRFNSFLSLLRGLGVALGGLIAVASVFMVANAMHLVIYARRLELETMKLVGATWAFVATPFVLEGAVQGLVGALLGLGAAAALHRYLLVQLQEALTAALGSAPLTFLDARTLLALTAIGMGLGMAGCWRAARRFWRAAP